MSTEITSTAAVDSPDLTKFQEQVLLVLAEEGRYGLAIKRELEDYYGDDVNHGRLYPNLDQLVERGFVEVSEIDKRTNLYEITDAGRHALRSDLTWRIDHMDVKLDEDGDLQEVQD